MKIICISIAMMLSTATMCQVTGVSLKTSGLTCSMCSNAINKALKTLGCVDKVDADISNYTFEISFKEGSEIDFDRIKSKVEGAGFSVAGFTAMMRFKNEQLSSDSAVKVGSMTIYFLNPPATVLNGTHQVKILNKGYVSAKEFRKKNILAYTGGTGIYYAQL